MAQIQPLVLELPYAMDAAIKLKKKFFYLFRAAPSTYGSSQARGRIRAAAAGLCHSNSESELCLRPTPQLMAMPDS